MEGQPLYEEGRRTLSLSHEVLRHYNSMNGPVKGVDLKLEARSNSQDKRDVLEIIDRGKQLGEKMIQTSVSPSAGDAPLAMTQPASGADEVATGFFEKSLAQVEETPSGKGPWGLWMAWDKVVKGLQGDGS